MTYPALGEGERETGVGARIGGAKAQEPMTAILPAPAYVLARAAMIPTLVIWLADGRFIRLEGAPCADYAAALAASWRLRSHRGASPDGGRA